MVSKVGETTVVKGMSNENKKIVTYNKCNKGKNSKFKRSTSNLEDDGLSAAIFFIACIACTPSPAPAPGPPSY
ncbi:hypothetical protein ABFS83_09G060000 [Erythranthe nasuta]